MRHVDKESLTLSTHPVFLNHISRTLLEVALGKTLSNEETKLAQLTTREAE